MKTPRKTTIKLTTFGLAGRLGTCLLFVSVEEERGKKRKKQKPCECNFISIISVSMSTTYSCSGTHHHGEAGGGFL